MDDHLALARDRQASEAGFGGDAPEAPIAAPVAAPIAAAG
jgi:hypothetical protein